MRNILLSLLIWSSPLLAELNPDEIEFAAENIAFYESVKVQEIEREKDAAILANLYFEKYSAFSGSPIRIKDADSEWKFSVGYGYGLTESGETIVINKEDGALSHNTWPKDLASNLVAEKLVELRAHAPE
ncbi:hypothetical protein [Microbulbifer sp. SAOS-129_SWC]|uniref:hypothetical protein n=1 Tax=Microbulbifer sp. SAOS-129_SWC TaxID=3145235 RepID=UPI0032173E57